MDEEKTTTSEEAQVTEETTATEATEETKEAKEGEEAKGKVKTYSEEDIEKVKASVKGGYEGTVKEMKGRVEKLQQELDQAIASATQLQSESFLKSVETQGLDVNMARQIVERERAVSAKERQFNTAIAQLVEKEAELSKAAKSKQATDLISEYGLPKEKISELLEAETSSDMENKALKLYITKTKTEAKKSVKVDQGTQTGKAGIDISKMNPSEALGLAIEGKI